MSTDGVDSGVSSISSILGGTLGKCKSIASRFLEMAISGGGRDGQTGFREVGQLSLAGYGTRSGACPGYTVPRNRDGDPETLQDSDR